MPVILLTFIFSKGLAQSTDSSNHIINVHTADTSLKKIGDDVVGPLTLPLIPLKTTCDQDFAETASGGFTPYAYSTGNPSVATINQTTGVVHITGAGVSTVTVTDAQGKKASATLTVDQAIPQSVTISESIPVSCLGKFVNFTATPSAGITGANYQFIVTDNTSNKYSAQNSNNPVVSLSNLLTGNTIYCIMTDNSGGCTALQQVTSNTITVKVVPYSTISVSLSQSPEGTILSGTPITFTATPTLTPPYTAEHYNYDYQWQLNGNDIPGANGATFTSSCSRNDDAYNCVVTPQGAPCLIAPSAIAAIDQRVSITESGVPVTASITASANGVYAGTIIDFKATLSSNAQPVAYQWQINGVDTSDVTSELSTFSLKNNDVVTCVIFTNNGCTQVVISNPIKMVIYPAPGISIPNTFTPNGDGINDVWDIKYLYLYHYATVKIFNRYGSLLFQSKGYDVPWDGKYKGQVVPSGTYYYVINMGTHTPYLSGALTVIK